VILDVLFVLAVTAALMSNFFGVPGNIIIAFNSLIYGILTNFDSYSLTFVITLFIIVIFVEFIEYLLIALTAKKYGASKWGIAGGIIGGIGGAISGAFFTPVLGAIIGSILGVFLGAIIFEYFRSFDLKMAFNSGVGAFLGKIGGLSLKTCGAVTMIIMIGYKIF
jgi:uncharacterized protein YqgC (DUF456 family)